MQRKYDYLLKIVLVGSTAVGKSALLKRYADNEFNEFYISTIGVDFRFKYPYHDVDLFLLVLISLSYKYGILQVSRDLKELLNPIITMQML